MLISLQGGCFRWCDGRARPLIWHQVLKLRIQIYISPNLAVKELGTKWMVNDGFIMSTLWVMQNHCNFCLCRHQQTLSATLTWVIDRFRKNVGAVRLAGSVWTAQLWAQLLLPLSWNKWIFDVLKKTYLDKSLEMQYWVIVVLYTSNICLSLQFCTKQNFSLFFLIQIMEKNILTTT